MSLFYVQPLNSIYIIIHSGLGFACIFMKERVFRLRHRYSHTCMRKVGKANELYSLLELIF